MTPIRAKEIIRTAHEAATPGPWVDQIDRLIDATEREEINSIWERMPGYSTFVDALQRIADDRTDELNYEWELRFNYGYSLTLTGSYSKCANQHSNYRFDKRYVLVKTDRRFKNIDDTIDYEHNRQVSSQHAEMVNGNGTLYCCRCGTIGENDSPEIRKWHGDRLPRVGDTVTVTKLYNDKDWPDGEPGFMWPNVPTGYSFVVGRIVPTAESLHSIPNVYSEGGWGPIPLNCLKRIK